MKQPWFPASVGVAIYLFIIAATLIAIGGRLLDNWGKTNYNYNKYVCQRKDVLMEIVVVVGKDIGEWDLSKFFSGVVII